MRPAILDALFWIAALACAIAQFFIIRAVFRPSLPMDAGPHGAALPARRQSGRIQEIVWAVLPSLLLAATFVFAWRIMHPATASSALALLR